jgi:periplasmic divalent cation tolerance protein
MSLRVSMLLVLCTCPDAASGERIARTLVEERLAACVNRVPGLISVYRWQDAVESAAEELLLIKTTRDAFPALQARLLALHPYALPEVIALPVDHGHMPYLDWVRAAVTPA